MQIAVPIVNHVSQIKSYLSNISKLVTSVVVKDSLLFGPPPFKIEEVSSESFSLLVTGGIVILNKVYFYLNKIRPD